MKASDYLGEYEDYLKGLRLKAGTIRSKLRGVLFFEESFLKGGKEDLRETEEKDFLRFAGFLKERKLSTGTINHYLSAVRQFFTYLYKNDLILQPVGDLVPSVKTVSREKAIFTVEEISRFLDSIETNLRDRVFFELLYSSGLRCSEALNLQWKEINFKSRKLIVEQGKGDRDRYVPFSRAASFFLKSWKRVSYTGAESYLFPGLYRGHLTYACMKVRFTQYLTESGIEKKRLTIHSIRHSCATHLLEAGADVRYVSELLGHRNMETTVRYTHPTEESQRKAYRMYHPRENGYYRELDEEYEAELDTLHKKFQEREAFVRRYVRKG
ncbi:MAG: tyrosine-type recombinase/integrase [Spirochaetales bacterium]|nr:tyrosine-type recombinase/integrase [Spirochaetales bacterium]